MKARVWILTVAAACLVGCTDNYTPTCRGDAGAGDAGVVTTLKLTIEQLVAEDAGTETSIQIDATIPCLSATAAPRATLTISNGLFAGASAATTTVLLTPIASTATSGAVRGFVTASIPDGQGVWLTAVLGDDTTSLLFGSDAGAM